ncbi:MAG TPA: methionyl-tRNA formyltransferase [Clostridia bacterium]
MKVIYLGTPEFGVLPLEKLLKSHHNVIAVVSQPDRPAGRGYKLISPPIVNTAKENNIPVYQFKSIKKEGVEILKNLKPDVMVTAAYGQILSKEILEIAPHGVINVHGSLLPKYRGAAPIQWAIINGETKTGITIMQTAEGLDNGDMILKKEVNIEPNDNAVTLTKKMSQVGADALLEALDLIEQGKATFTPQDESQSSYYPMLTKDLGKIDWSKSAQEINCLIRGLYDWPGTYSTLWGVKFKIIEAEVNSKSYPVKPGTIVNLDKYITVMCGKDCLNILKIQEQNGKAMSTVDYLRGHKRYIGERFE